MDNHWIDCKFMSATNLVNRTNICTKKHAIEKKLSDRWQEHNIYLGINPMSHPSFTTLPIHQSSLNFCKLSVKSHLVYYWRNIPRINRTAWVQIKFKTILKSICPKKNFKTFRCCERWINHDMSMGQRKNLSSRQESNPWPPKHWAGTLSATLRELMESKVIFTEFMCDRRPAYC